MTTATEHVEHTEHGDDTHDGHAAHGTRFYIGIAVFLAALTAIETATYWVDLGPLFMPVLMVAMIVKFYTVVAFFMHLRSDSRIFAWLFYSGLFLAVGVYVVALFTFKFFDAP